MTTAMAVLVDGAVIAALALIASAAARGRSAAIRHAMLVTAVIAALAMPALELALPIVPVIERAAPVYERTPDAGLVSDASSSVAGSGPVGEPGGASWLEIAVLIWAAGAIVIIAGLATSMIRLARLRARATCVSGVWRALTDELAPVAGVRRPIALLQNADPSLLVTCGLLRPAIIVPAGASSWPRDRIRNVLRHELAHIARHDAAIQTAAELFRALHWINPLAWTLCRRLRQESEYACDDSVLRAGVRAEDYARDLLAVARQLSARRQFAAAHAIAHPSTLERRIAAMLYRQRNRAALRRRAWIAAAAVALGVSVPIAAAGIADAAPIEIASPPDGLLPSSDAAANAAGDLQQTPPPPPPPRPVVRRDPPAPGQTGALVEGTIVDQLGGVVPGATVTLRDVRSGSTLSTNSDASGRFSLRGVPASQYELSIRLPGFKTVIEKVTLTGGAVLRRTITLSIGMLQETVHVTCSPQVSAFRLRFMPVAHAQERPQAPIRVGGSVRAPRKTKNVKPVCPSNAPAGEFTIELTGRVEKDGTIQKLALAGTAPPPALVEAAMTAVGQWVYSPTLLNGVPIDVDIAVRVSFTKK